MGLFKSDPSPIEQAVIKATDENLTTEDWSRIIEVCDEVNSKPGKNGPLAIEALRKRLNTQNGNVQLFSLTLLNALAQNCGSSVRREIASGPTTSALSAIGTNPSTHRTILVRLIEILSQITDQFSSDSTLGQVQLAYDRVCRAHPTLAPKKNSREGHSSSGRSKSSSSRGAASSQTTSNGFPIDNKGQAATNTNEEQDEDEDLRRALELSLKDMGRPQAEVEAASHRPLQARHQVRALYDFTATEEGELTFQTGDVIEVVDRVYKEWWKGLLNGQEGIFPVNYVESIEQPQQQQQQQDQAQDLYDDQDYTPSAATGSLSTGNSGFRQPSTMDESYIFGQAPAVEKLLTILASASQSGDGGNVIGNRDVQQLYHQIASMRPRLVQLIDEYTMKKQELVDFNQKLLQARRSYEKLMADAASGQYRSQIQQPTGTSHHSLSSVLNPQLQQSPQLQQGLYDQQTYPPQGYQTHPSQYHPLQAYNHGERGQLPQAYLPNNYPSPFANQQTGISTGPPQPSVPPQSVLQTPSQALQHASPQVPVQTSPAAPVPSSPRAPAQSVQQSMSHPAYNPYDPSHASTAGYRLPYPDDTRESVHSPAAVQSLPHTNGIPSSTVSSGQPY